MRKQRRKIMVAIPIEGRLWNAEKIRFLRKKLGLSQKKFARILDASQEAISSWENSRTRPSEYFQDELTMLARRNNVFITLENVELEYLRKSTQDLIDYIYQALLLKSKSIKFSQRVLSALTQKVSHAMMDIDWDIYLYANSGDDYPDDFLQYKSK